MQNSDPRIIFWGTSDFAIPALEALLQGKHRVVAVITNPDEPAGRKQIITPPPVKTAALKYKIPVLQPASLANSKEEIINLKPDLFIVAAYGKIMSKDMLYIPKLGALNIHPSLLPRWRGPSPIQYTILAGDNEAGVTIIKMDELMDHGPILAKRELANYKSEAADYKNLHDELAKLGAELIVEALPRFLKGECSPIPQDDSAATYSKILKKDDGRIDWKKSSREIERLTRAFNPWPGSWTLWPSNSKIYRVRIEQAEWMEKEGISGGPGYVYAAEPGTILVKTGDGTLGIKKLTLEGKNPTDAESFMRGHPSFMHITLI